tara:strand:- start:1505 stop:2134 length:630 start_codon:yes stop_codon:yes gene_type:complete
MQKINIHQIDFITSAAELKQLPADNGFEVAFAGRSNAGKSSTLNAIANRRQLARISRTPGRTQLINLFSVGEDRRLVDLPGYGYAKVSEEVKMRWQKTLGQYLQHRNCLKGIVLVTDVRHAFNPLDEQLLVWAQECQLPLHLILNKADKLKKNQQIKALRQAKDILKHDYDAQHSVQLFSALRKDGVEILLQKLTQWYFPEQEPAPPEE